MNLFRILSGGAFLGLVGTGLSGCLNAPSYSIIPAIDFKDLQVVHVPRSSSQTAVDTIKFALNFRDGDGDLGLSPDDLKMAPFNTSTGGHNNRGYGYNYFIQPFIKNASGNFVPFTTPGGTVGEYDSYFPRLDGTDAKPSPLKGVLNYKFFLNIDGVVFQPGQVFRFEISILDRALHESNKITTSEVTLGK